MTRWPDDPIPRRPGTAARVLLFLAVLFGYALTLSIAFPPGAPDRLPVLVLSILLALATAQRWARGARLFAFLFPCAGLIARLAGGSDPAAWPTLLFAGFATGWAFRFIYDFDTRPDPSGPDAAVRALLALWAVSTLFAVVEARTLWALWHGLSGRTVNGDGLPESTAIRESLLSFGALASGAGFFLVLRRSGEAIRRQTLVAALSGATLCAAAAILQRLAVLAPERNPFWKTTERLSGGAVDPNSLGLVCAMALVIVAVGVFGRWGRRRLPSAMAAVVLGLGLVLSGSRSGLLVVVASLILLPALRAKARSVRAIGLSAAAAAALLVALLLLSGSRGTLGGRLVDSFDPSQPVASRVSARPMLWSAAWRLFRENPIAGGGMGVYAWRLPDLLRPQGVHLKLRDNPGSAYFQALAETGILGLALTLFFAAALARDAARRLARGGGEGSDDGLQTASALASLSFLAALAVGSHWLAGDTSLFFFLAAAVGVLPAPEKRAFPPRAWLGAAVLLYAAAAAVAMLSTARPEEAFRYGPRIGFYPPEPGRNGPFQWTRQNFALWLSPRQRVKFGLAHFSPVGRPLEIRAFEGERILYRRTLAPGEAVVLHLSGAVSRPAAVRFEASRSFVPRNFGIPGGDVRRLGLQSVFFDR
jgi:O-antigen ligase